MKQKSLPKPRRRHFKVWIDDNGSGFKAPIRMVVDKGWVVLHEKGRRAKFTMPLSEAVGMLFRRAQVRQCQTLLGNSATVSSGASPASGPSSTSPTPLILASEIPSGPSVCEPASESNASDERSSETGTSPQESPTS